MKEFIPINFLEFFKTGRFDCIQLGKTKEWILANFPSPDDFGIGDTLASAAIWRYGNIEFHFYQDTLFLIYSDYLETLSGGEQLKLDKWILENPSALTLAKVITALNQHHIDFKKKTSKDNIRLRLQSGIELSFHNSTENENANPNEFLLGSFGLQEEIKSRWE